MLYTSYKLVLIRPNQTRESLKFETSKEVDEYLKANTSKLPHSTKISVLEIKEKVTKRYVTNVTVSTKLVKQSVEA